ncbi:hypothetical protein [Actinocorallia aurantiaca]|uniref:Uncharacterized protein n=1 Tax=Actinocorallia aurantiaca TaxID=46204 RepID=A0ABP6GEH9_9ACTN
MKPFAELREQLLDAAGAFAEGPGALSGILAGMVDDVDRALREDLEIFPVCHHSPSSALAMARRLREKRPKVVYLEMCDDLGPLLDELRNCRLPVALQAFATELDGFPAAWAPLSVIAPITEASAEYQAIAYALETPGVELVPVDRSSDHVFQWEPRERAEPAGKAAPDEEAALHGDSVGVELGDLRPRFAELEEHLLHHGKVRHWSEWWDQYVEQPLSGADYDTYRQVMVMIGSLFRRLRRDGDDHRDEERERYMWTRMREHLASSGTDPADCLYVCGAFHAASRVEQFGAASTAPYEITPRTGTRWQYGLIPSSHSAIEAQFGLAPGSVSIASATWSKALRRGGVEPFRLKGQKGTRRQTGGLPSAASPSGGADPSFRREENTLQQTAPTASGPAVGRATELPAGLPEQAGPGATEPQAQEGAQQAGPDVAEPQAREGAQQAGPGATEPQAQEGAQQAGPGATEPQAQEGAQQAGPGATEPQAREGAQQAGSGAAEPQAREGAQQAGSGAAEPQAQEGAQRAAAFGSSGRVDDRLSGFLASPPAQDGLDEAELLGWCVDIVRLARRNGYQASTADAIAVFETSVLLANMRNRRRPTPYDFQDAAVTCIEKETVPGRRDVARLCEILLGGDRIGQVGYESLPPLARDVLDRLEPLGLDLQKRTIQRALLDLKARPELNQCSDLLWILQRLLPQGTVRPIMGSRGLGERSIQESWDLALGRDQRALVELGYEGVSVEQVLEQRLRRAVWDPKATASTALAAVEDAVRLLPGQRLPDELGARAVELLSAERDVDDAPEVLRRIRRLLSHYRATQPALPRWCESFVTTGYAHYCTLLPTAFTEEETGLRQVAAMLGFLFGMESLALSLGCDHAQLEIAVRQSHPESPAKTALLWAVRSRLGLLSQDELRSLSDGLLDNPFTLEAFPHYLSGFIHSLDPVPAMTPFVVELMSKAFARLPDSVLLPWLPKLITALRAEARELVPVLVREAARTFPAALPVLDAWTPPWSAQRPPTTTRRPVESGPAAALLAAHPQTCEAVAALLGHDPVWRESAPTAEGPEEAAALLTRHPETATAVAALL